MSWEWLVALIGRDVLSGRSVEAEAAGLFAELALGETENRLLIRGLTCEASSEVENRLPAQDLSCEASSEAENR